MSMTPEQIDELGDNLCEYVPSGSLEALAQIIDLAKRGLAFDDAVMDCKGYDLFPDGTMRPAHGLGEWVKAEDYDKLHAAAEAAQAEIAALRNFVDKNMVFYDVDADSLVDAPNIPVLAQVSNRIWYHATDDTKSCPFSAVIDAAMKECGK